LYSTHVYIVQYTCLHCTALGSITKIIITYFDVCAVHLVQFITQTNKCKTYIY